MRHDGRIGRRALAGLALCALAVGAYAGAAASADLVRVGRLVLRVDGRFIPRKMPARKFIPIVIKGKASITATDGSTPPRLTALRLDLDRNGKIQTRGLPACRPEQLANTTPVEARNRCRRSIVATGKVAARIVYPGQRPFGATSPLTVFNGPRTSIGPVVLMHGYMQFPAPETYVVPAQIRRLGRGAFSYQVTADIPPIAGGYGAITRGNADIGRKYRFRGKRRSFLNARCPTSVLHAHGRFTFDDGTIIDGTIFRPCDKLAAKRKRKGRR